MKTSNSDESFQKKRLERSSEAKLIRRITLVIFILFLTGLMATVFGGYSYIKSALQPVDPENNSPVSVTIPLGSSVSSIARVLEENGVIKNGKVFRYYVKFRNEGGEFQAGDYELTKSMTFEELIASLKTGRVIKESVFAMTIPEGKQIPEIAIIISNNTEHTEEEVLEKLSDEEFIKELITLYPTILTEEILNEQIRHPLEGYLFPARYSFYEDNPSIDSIIKTMLDKTEDIVLPYQAKIGELGWTIHEFMTLSSIIEEEATEHSDRTKISSVFYNRLNIDMPLQTDPTVLYALGFHKVHITYDDLKVQSPYNTYANKGLPIGPISNAGLTSIEAALAPDESKFFYFYARPSGEVIFTKTLQEHNSIVAKYDHEWDNLE